MMKKILFMIGLFFWVVLGVSAEGTVSLVTERFETEEVTSFYNVGSYSRTAVFGEGVVTFKSQTSDKVTIFYYDLDGNFISSLKMDDNQRIMYMEEYNDYLYILASSSDFVLYKVDKEMNIVDSIYFEYSTAYNHTWYSWKSLNFGNWSIDYGESPLRFTDDCIMVALQTSYFDTSNKIRYDYLYYVDYEFENAVLAYNSDLDAENIDLYFGSVYSISYKDEESNAYDYYGSYDNGENFSVYSGYISTTDGSSAVLSLANDEGIVWRIRNDDYLKFYSVKIYDEKIVLLAGRVYDINSRHFLSDVLIYNMDGELEETIEFNKSLTYLSENDINLVVSVSDVDGLCSSDKYSSSTGGYADKYAPTDDGCDILSTFRVYTLTSKMPVVEDSTGSVEEEKTDNSLLPTNPNTSAISVICIGIVALVSIFVSVKVVKKIKYLK